MVTVVFTAYRASVVGHIYRCPSLSVLFASGFSSTTEGEPRIGVSSLLLAELVSSTVSQAEI